MKRSAFWLIAAVAAVAASQLVVGTASAATPLVVVVPPAPPAGPIPIPYPNLHSVSTQSGAALTGFVRAESATGGIIEVVTDNTGK